MISALVIVPANISQAPNLKGGEKKFKKEKVSLPIDTTEKQRQ